MAVDVRTRDTVNSLLNYDVSDNEDDPFREIDTTIHSPSRLPNGTKRKATSSDNKVNSDALGIDEEVKISKKRKAIAKLDEARLLSRPGIPKLRALARSKTIASKLRLKGKGHEYSDAAKLLGYYQLWLDDLYPKAKFADGLQMVEKVGHGKRMQVMRREWIDEGKPGYGDHTEEKRTLEKGVKVDENNNLSAGSRQEPAQTKSGARPKHDTHDSIFGDLDEGQDDDLFFSDQRGVAGQRDESVHEPDEDELDALLAEQGASTDFQPQQHQQIFEEEEEDELDALMAEQDAQIPQPTPSQHKQDSASSLNDDLDGSAVGSMADNRLPLEETPPEAVEVTGDGDEDEDEDEFELEALLAEHAASHPGQPSIHS